MKKFLFLIITIALTAFSYSASAQDSRLFGEWRMTISESLSKELNGLEKVDFQFNSNKTGKFLLSGKLSDSVPDSEYTMSMTMKFTCAFTWELKGDTLELDFNSVDLDFEDFTVLPQSSESELIASVLKGLMTEELKKYKEALQTELLTQMGINENRVDIEFFGKDIFKFKDEDEIIFKRLAQ